MKTLAVVAAFLLMAVSVCMISCALAIYFMPEKIPVLLGEERKTPEPIAEKTPEKPTDERVEKSLQPAAVKSVESKENEFDYGEPTPDESYEDVTTDTGEEIGEIYTDTDIKEEAIKPNIEDDKKDTKYDAATGGPPPQKTAAIFPIFMPISNATGPVAQPVPQGDIRMADQPSPQMPSSALSEAADEYGDSETAEGYHYAEKDDYEYIKPVGPPDVQTEPLPPFTPVTNKTGPVGNLD